MKQIENKEDLLKWAQEINSFQYSQARKCDLQDIYAHSQADTIDAAFIELIAERKLIICSVNNIMAFEEVERLLKVLAQHKVSKQMKLEYVELDRREAQLAARERAQQDSRKPYHKRLAAQNKMIEGLQRVNRDLTASQDRMRAERNTAILEARQFEVDAEKYRTIKQLLV